MVKVGQKVKFNPFKGIRIGNALPANITLTGTIVEVHEDHRWFSVVYTDEEKKKRRTSFNFADIGQNVQICM